MFFLSFVNSLSLTPTQPPFAPHVSCRNRQECSGQHLESTIDTQGYKGAAGNGTSVIVPQFHSGDRLQCTSGFGCSSMDYIIWNTSNDAWLNCWGSNSCSNNLIRTSSIRDSAKWKNITNNTSINPLGRCWGVGACSNSHWINTENITEGGLIQCGGDRSCKKSTFEGVWKISAEGAWSIKDSIIKSAGTDVKITLSGYHAGQNATVICDVGDFCKIVLFVAICVIFFFVSSCIIYTEMLFICMQWNAISLQQQLRIPRNRMGNKRSHRCCI